MERGLHHSMKSHSRGSRGSGKVGAGVRFGVSCGYRLGGSGVRVLAEQQAPGKRMQIIPRSFARCLLIKGDDIK